MGPSLVAYVPNNDSHLHVLGTTETYIRRQACTVAHACPIISKYNPVDYSDRVVVIVDIVVVPA